MGLGQTILTILSLMLMGRLVISMNTSTLNAGVTKDLAEYRISGISLGISLLEQINSLSFDEATVDFAVAPNVVSSFTTASSFGTGKGETSLGEDDIPYSESGTVTNHLLVDADDIDDYHDFVEVDSIKENGAVYTLRATVQYASIAGATVTPTAGPTARKLVTVEVTGDYLVDYSVNPPRRDTLRFQSVMGYWFFR